MDPTNLALLIADLRRDEGVRYSPYMDTTGHLSVGVGRNLTVFPLPAGWTYPLTDAQVNQLLTQDLQNTFAQLDAKLPWWRTLDAVRQRVIANMAFNLGVAGLMTFKTALGAMQRGSYAIAAAAMLNSQWARQVGMRAQRLCYAMEHDVMLAVVPPVYSSGA
ncbi:glycoside hydrolase family protein [Paraburkholderia tropica]|uniref:glycoside hydrolase family protein n=1 Tax=Paraburkholderia tropica TaxID=92647 RepID=UPI0007EC32A0|nr:glycoside hydrolase family protein [Paraburkholderia tropica]